MSSASWTVVATQAYLYQAVHHQNTLHDKNVVLSQQFSDFLSNATCVINQQRWKSCNEWPAICLTFYMAPTINPSAANQRTSHLRRNSVQNKVFFYQGSNSSNGQQIITGNVMEVLYRKKWRGWKSTPQRNKWLRFTVPQMKNVTHFREHNVEKEGE